MSRTRSSRQLFGLVVVALALVVTACGGTADEVAGSAERDPETGLAGYQLDPESDVSSVTLPAVNRPTDAFALTAEPGKLLLTTFGFTNCPDICPTTLADMRLAFTNLGPRADDVDLAWISIDPERDTPEGTANYVEAFIDKGIALRTDDAEQLDFAKDAFGVTVLFQELEDGGVEVAHTANIYVIDENGAIILTWPFGISSVDMQSDLTILLDQLERA